MNKKQILLSMMAMLVMVPASLSAKSYYVSANGDDNNPGSKSQPFASISKAASIMVAGDECQIMEGVYHEVLAPKNSGTEKKPITFSSYKDDCVLIDATEPVNGWTKHSGNIYKANKKMANATSIYNTLFHNGEVLDVARWPNNEDGDKFTFDGHQVDGGSGSHFETHGMPNIDLVGGYFCYLGAHSGTSWSRVIDSYKDGEIHFEGVDITRWPYTPHNPTIERVNGRGQLFVFGTLELLDAPGEWYYDAKNETIYAYFADGNAPKEGSVKAGVRANTMELSSDYITIDGIDCFGGEIIISGNNCSISNGEFINCSQSLDRLIGRAAQSEASTMYITGSNIKIENNLLDGGIANGISILPEKDNGENYLVHNNVIRNYNTIGIHAKPVLSRGERTTITHNTIYSCGRDGVTTFGKYSEIAYNDISDCMKVNNDGGVFYTVGNDELKHTSIHHNYMHDSYGPEYADGRAAGIYLDNHSKGYDVHHNIVWNITWSALMFNWYNTDFRFFNNTVWNAGYNMGRWANGYGFDRIYVINNFSNVTSGDKIEKKRDEANWIGDEKYNNILQEESPFVSAEKKNFIPVKGSSVVDKGIIIDNFSKEHGYKGKRPDIGAYEYGEKPWVVGATWANDVVGDDLVYSDQKREAYNSSQKREDENTIFKVMVKEKE